MVVTGIPIEVTDAEVKDSLSKHGIVFVKRLKRKTDKGFVDSLSYLLCFEATTPPESINFGYIRLLTRPYNPPATALSQMP